MPFAFIADILAFKATEREVFIYSPELKLIASHERHPAGEARRVEEPKHHLSGQSRYGLEPVREAFLALGEAAPDFLAGLKHRNPHHCGFHARFILRLKEYYHADEIHAALRHALRYQAYDGKAIERILKAKATPRPLESHRVDQARAVLQKVLPKITQRELSEYCQLFSKKKDDPHETTMRIKELLKMLRLCRMEKALDEQLTKAVQEATPVCEVILCLLEIETNTLIERRIERRIRQSRLPERKLLADFDFAFQKDGFVKSDPSTTF